MLRHMEQPCSSGSLCYNRGSMGGLSQFEDHAGERTAQQRHTKPPSSSMDAPNPPQTAAPHCAQWWHKAWKPLLIPSRAHRGCCGSPRPVSCPRHARLSPFSCLTAGLGQPQCTLSVPQVQPQLGAAQRSRSAPPPFAPYLLLMGQDISNAPPPPSPPGLKYPNETLGAEEVSPRTAHHSHSGARPSRCDLSSFDHRRKPEVILLNH